MTVIILGVDPGLTATGVGVIEVCEGRLRCLKAGDLRPPRSEPLAQRLGFLREGLSQLILRHRPDIVVLEKIFTHHHHVTTATLMGHARGVACVAAQEHGLPVAEYPTTHVKRSLTGNGHASKEQVARMVAQWLEREPEMGHSSDATDALALAIVHAHATAQQRNLPRGMCR